MQLINGLALSQAILEKIQNKIHEKGLKPRLDIIWVGSNEASEVYIEKKKEAGQKVGLAVEVHNFTDANESELGELVSHLNTNHEVNGIIIQLPLNKLNPLNLMAQISHEKDVDGLNPTSLGKLWQGNIDTQESAFIPATVKAVMHVLMYVVKAQSMDLKSFFNGKNCLIINRSNILGKPLAAILVKNNSTVTIAHSKTENLHELVSKSDIVVSATGKNGILNGAKFKKNSILIDVGFTRKEGKILGDLPENFSDDNVVWFSPVPNGVGPLGVAFLLENTMIAALDQTHL